MKSIVSTIFFLMCVSLLFWSCQHPDYSTDLSASDNLNKGGQTNTIVRQPTPSGLEFPDTVILAGFTVSYNGRTVANDQTTFSYTVSGPAVQMAFRLELPGCAPALVSWDPTNGKQSSNDADVNPGIEWSPDVGSGSTNTFHFTLTYPGTVQQGIILTKVKSTSTSEVGFITGACARVYDISGSVFTDGNSNSLRDGAETGILGATVNLCDALGGPLAATTTNSNGDYLFSGLPAGNYVVKVDTESVAGTHTTYLGATTATSYDVTLGPSSTGNNFGFAPKSAKLINDLKFGLLPTNGLTAGFWKKQLQSAVNGTGTPVVSRDSLIAYIARIRVLLLTEPFQLGGGGTGLLEALNLLSKPVKTDLDYLKQQLLALEFNHVSNHGIVSTDPSLQLTLIGWGEALVANSPTTSESVIVKTYVTSAATAADVYTQINKSSGGGGSF